MPTISALLLFAAAIILMVIAIARFKVHPFLAILGTALLLALLLGVPFADIPDVIGKGFGGVSSGIALVIHTLRAMNELGGKLRLTSVPPQPRKVLLASGIQNLVALSQERSPA